MKTIREWLEGLPEPYRGQALKNMRPQNASLAAEDTVDALFTAFTWSETPQGTDYWRDLKNRYRDAPAEPPTNALSALHAIALKKGFAVEEIMSVQQDDGIPDMWYYTLKNNTWVFNISLSNDK